MFADTFHQIGVCSQCWSSVLTVGSRKPVIQMKGYQSIFGPQKVLSFSNPFGGTIPCPETLQFSRSHHSWFASLPHARTAPLSITSSTQNAQSKFSGTEFGILIVRCFATIHGQNSYRWQLFTWSIEHQEGASRLFPFFLTWIQHLFEVRGLSVVFFDRILGFDEWVPGLNQRIFFSRMTLWALSMVVSRLCFILALSMNDKPLSVAIESGTESMSWFVSSCWAIGNSCNEMFWIRVCAVPDETSGKPSL